MNPFGDTDSKIQKEQEGQGQRDKDDRKEIIVANLFPLPNLILNPAGKLTLNIFEPRYLNLLESCEKDNILMAIAHASTVQDEKHPIIIPHEHFPYIHEQVGFGKVQVLAETDAGTKVIVISGSGKGKVKAVHKAAGGFLSVEIEEIKTANELDSLMTFMFRRLKMITEEKVRELLKNDREVQVLMNNLQRPEELVAFYSDHILKDPNIKLAVFHANDINEKLEIIGRSLLH